MIRIFHNNRCSKSRCALEILQTKGVDFEIKNYLQDPPTEAELKDLIKKLNIEPVELIRKGEQVFKDEYKEKELTGAQWIKAMVKHPVLIERPIVINGDKAVVARPPELAEKVL